jgi:UDP-N-acetylglucosamine:LPS N-acetylglucosamine transferase
MVRLPDVLTQAEVAKARIGCNVVGQRVLIVSASMGGGHDGVAYELQRRLRLRGHEVEVRDYLAALPLRIGHFIGWFYAMQLRLAPRSYQALYSVVEQSRLVLGFARWLASWACPRLRRWVRGQDLIIATYPLAGQALGRMRRRGLGATVTVFLTDFSAHPLWVAPGADLHLVLHEVTERQVRACDAQAPVRVGGPAVRHAFAPSPGGMDAAARVGLRRRYGIPEDEPFALMVAGSWGVGEVARAARELVDDGRFVPVVVCGRNDALRAWLAADGIGVALGWVDDMAALMRCADVMVQNAGGLTSLEALALGLPVISYNCLPGHGRSNADAMAKAGVALHACRMGSLPRALDDLDELTSRRLCRRAAMLFDREPIATLMESLAGRALDPQRRQPARGRRPLAVIAAAFVALTVASAPLTTPQLAEEKEDLTAVVRTVRQRVAHLSSFRIHRPVSRRTAIGTDHSKQD